jgi:hypothetical protein
MSVLDILAQDSGNRNVPNAQGSGASGYFQILKGNWNKLAPGLGISAPTALSATPTEQAIVAADLFNNSGGAANWGAGQSWPHLSVFDNNPALGPGSAVTAGDIANFGVAHGDNTLAALAGSGPVGGDLTIPSPDTSTPGFVSAPDGSGFSSGLTPGAAGAPASTNADFPNIDLGNLSVGNLIPGGTASQGTGLSVSPDLSSGALGTQDVSGTGTFQNLGDTPTSIAANQAAQSKLIPNLWTDIVTFSQRAAVIVLGLVLIALAAAALVRHNTLLPAIGKGSRGL